MEGQISCRIGYNVCCKFTKVENSSYFIILLELEFQVIFTCTENKWKILQSDVVPTVTIYSKVCNKDLFALRLTFLTCLNLKTTSISWQIDKEMSIYCKTSKPFRLSVVVLSGLLFQGKFTRITGTSSLCFHDDQNWYQDSSTINPIMLKLILIPTTADVTGQ